MPAPPRICVISELFHPEVDGGQGRQAFAPASEHEGFGLALAEAMACGLPSLTTPVGIAAEVIESGVNGVLVPVGNANALTTAIDRLLRAPERWEKLGIAGRFTLLRNYDLQAAVAKFMHALSSLPAAAGVLVGA